MTAYNRDVYGPQHKKQRQVLMFQLKDGTECEVCGEPMFRDASKNWDGCPLEADHEDADTSQLAGRLIHSKCNKSIIGAWVKHGPGWFEKHGVDSASLNVDGGVVTSW